MVPFRSFFKKSEDKVRSWLGLAVLINALGCPEAPTDTAAGYEALAERVAALEQGEAACDCVSPTELAYELENLPSNNVGVMVPVGTILAWHKHLAGVPALPEGWLECNGQVIDDPASPMFGATLPDLNVSGRFLRGSTVSGEEQDSAFEDHTHSHSFTVTGGGEHDHQITGFSGGDAFPNGVDSSHGGADAGSLNIDFGGTHTHGIAGAILSASSGNMDNETRPANMSVVWIMRVF